MTENFRLDPDGLSAATKRLGAMGEKLRASYTELVRVLDEHDGCWGGDDIGKSFAQNYVPNARKARDSAQEATEGIVQLGDDTDSAAATFESVDHDSAQRIDAATSRNS
ncbi:hypothetical protein FNH05_35490 [Amycolatopsis rhizosphaerae]|uniref:WXG100 family type VII secretion target n=1 Tax=Amycolatopsis rhizosphaerae TaxID=2053003 RepID=A0A558A2N4_9PSEU|nr:hypothetical protein [Amycolatopsis rhizosphaerae]TVT18521.1 hypothetical protein FNH05_35490 [Amycolatopsis rhizosphaerae]